MGLVTSKSDHGDDEQGTRTAHRALSVNNTINFESAGWIAH